MAVRSNELDSADAAHADDLRTVSSGLASPQHLDANDRVGSVLGGRFELLRLIGSGAYGDVYEAAAREAPHEPLALKVLHATNAQALFRFKREFRGLSEVAHPNLAALHELVLDAQQAFFTMELVRGVDILSHVRPNGELDGQRLRNVVRQLITGVSALHELGRLHRDLKPSNVLVDDTGRLVIVDFGLLTEHDGSDGQELESGFVGTAAYAAPEQLLGDVVTGASDWYAVGTIVYEALAGHLPFGDVAVSSLAHAKRAGQPPEPSRPAALDDLALLAMRWLDPRPGARPAREEADRALGVALDPQPVATLTQEGPFVGRAVELLALEAAMSRVERGLRTIVRVQGASGLGKTSLVDHFLRALRESQRAIVLRGRCHLHEDVPYRALDGLVDALSHQLPDVARAEMAALSPSEAIALTRLFPVLRRLDEFAAPWRSGVLAGHQMSLREHGARGLRMLLARLAERTPVVLFIDDVQWDDADSAWLMTELLAGPDAPALLVVLACREDERARSHVLRALEDDAVLEAATRTIPLAPLSQLESVALLTAHGAQHDATGIARLAEESGGSPLFASELARADPAQSRSAVSLDAALRRRAAGLPEPERRLLETVCTARQRIKLTTALDACAGEASALRSLVLQRFVSCAGVGGSTTLWPYHDRIAEALVAGLPVAVVHGVRRNLAAALAREDDPRFELLVEQLLAAQAPADAACYAERAADQAASVLASYRVPALLELAVRHAAAEDRRRLQARLGEAYALVGRAHDAARAYDAAAELEADPARRWEFRRIAMSQAFQADELAMGMRLLKQLSRSAESAPIRLGWLSLLFNVFCALTWSFVGLPGLRAGASAPGMTAARRRLELAWSAATGLLYAHRTRALLYAIVALRASARLGDTAIYAPLYAAFSAAPAMGSGRPTLRAETGITCAAELARSHRDPTTSQFVSMCQGTYLLCTGQHARAHAVLGALHQERFAPSQIGRYLRSCLHLTSAPVAFWNGEVRSTHAHADAFIREAREQGEGSLEYGLRALAAYRFLCDDLPERALLEWTQVRTRYPGHAVMRDPLWGALIGLYAGRIDVAEDALALSGQRFWRWSMVAGPGRVLYFWTRGAIAAAKLARDPSDRRARRRLHSSAWLLGVESVGMSAPHREHLRAARAFLDQDQTRGLQLLVAAEAACVDHQLPLFAACASFALSSLHPQAELRAAYAEKARRVFEAQALVNPARWVHALLPGIPV